MIIKAKPLVLCCSSIRVRFLFLPFKLATVSKILISSFSLSKG